MRAEQHQIHVEQTVERPWNIQGGGGEPRNVDRGKKKLRRARSHLTQEKKQKACIQRGKKGKDGTSLACQKTVQESLHKSVKEKRKALKKQEKMVGFSGKHKLYNRQLQLICQNH